MEYNSALRRKKILIHAIIWMNFEDIMRSKGNKSVIKEQYCMILLI